MSDLTLRNLSIYLLLWLANALMGCLGVALAAGHVPGFGPDGFFAPVATELGLGLTAATAGLTLWLAANRPKLGREDVSALVKELGTINASKILYTALHGDSGDIQPLTDDELRRMAIILAPLVVEGIRLNMTQGKG